jgi:hypothetical protein
MFMYNGLTKDPPLYRLVPHCIGQLALLIPPLIIRRMLGGKGKSFSCPERPLYTHRDCGATSDVFSVHAGTCVSQYMSSEYSMYSMISMVRIYLLIWTLAARWRLLNILRKFPTEPTHGCRN